MNNEEEKRCPLCAEEMDWTDQQLNPCKCGYEVCVWCWHHIMDMAEKDATEGRCPACRTPYDKDRVVGLEANFERVAANGSSRKQKLGKAKPKANEGRKDLSNVRVIQRKMAYIIGLPLDLADEELLQRKEYFGQYGNVTKVSLSRTAGGALQQFTNDTCSVYITYSKEDEAVACIQAVHGYVLDGMLLRASFGTAKYCHAWLRNTPCNNPACLYLHTMGADEDSFGKDEVAAVHTRNRVQEIVGGTQYLQKRSGSMLPSPVVEQLNTSSASVEEYVCNDGLKEEAYSSVAFSDHLPCSEEKNEGDTHTESFANKDLSAYSDPFNLLEKDETCDPVAEFCKAAASRSESYSEPPFREEGLKLVSDSDVEYTLEQSGVMLDSGSEDDTSSVVNDGYNEIKFQSWAKSDMIYRGSNSFSNEEIVERLRRVDHDDHTLVNDDEDLESSIISNILAMDLDGSESSGFSQRVGLRSNDQSRFSFANEHGFSGQRVDLVSPSTNIGCRAQNLTPPGFSIPSKPPPGFSSSMRAEQVAANSGNYFRAALSDEYHYRSSSLGNVSMSSDDLIDPAVVAVAGKIPIRGLPNSWTSSFSSQSSSSFDDDNKHWNFMPQQQSAPTTAIHHQHQHQQHYQEPQFSLPTMQQQQQHHSLTQYPSSQDLHRQNYNPPLFTQQQPTYGGGGYQQQQEGHHDGRSEVERFGLESFLPGYGDYMFQMPPSGDVYTPRVFGM